MGEPLQCFAKTNNGAPSPSFPDVAPLEVSAGCCPGGAEANSSGLLWWAAWWGRVICAHCVYRKACRVWLKRTLPLLSTCATVVLCVKSALAFPLSRHNAIVRLCISMPCGRARGTLCAASSRVVGVNRVVFSSARSIFSMSLPPHTGEAGTLPEPLSRARCDHDRSHLGSLVFRVPCAVCGILERGVCASRERAPTHRRPSARARTPSDGRPLRVRAAEAPRVWLHALVALVASSAPCAG